MFKKISQKSVYKDAWLEFFQDEVEFPNGSKGTYAWTKRKDGVGVVVITKDKKVLLHKEFRYPIQSYSWEIQGGGIDQGETPKQAAVRELGEETGIVVDQSDLQRLGFYYPLSSLSTEKEYLFMVVINQVNVDATKTEDGELIDEQKYFTFAEVYQMIDDGKISDSFTANAVQLAIRKQNSK